MDESRMPERIMVSKIYARSRRWRPRVRWMAQVLEDMHLIGVKG